MLAAINTIELAFEVRPEKKKIQARTGFEPMTFAIPVGEVGKRENRYYNRASR